MSPVPGWYPDPVAPDGLRWFDGDDWTDRCAPAPDDAGTPVADPAHQAGPANHPSPGPQPWPGAPAAYGAPAWQATPTWGTAPAPTGRSTGKLVLVIALCVVGALVVTGVLAAIVIPVFLNQRGIARVDESRSLTCAQVATDAVALSASEAAKSTGPAAIALVALTDPVVVDDQRATLTRPRGGSTSFVMSCRGAGQWADGLTSTVTVKVYVDANGARQLTMTWE